MKVISMNVVPTREKTLAIRSVISRSWSCFTVNAVVDMVIFRDSQVNEALCRQRINFLSLERTPVGL